MNAWINIQHWLYSWSPYSGLKPFLECGMLNNTWRFMMKTVSPLPCEERQTNADITQACQNISPLSRSSPLTHIRTTFFTLKFSRGVTSGSWPLSFWRTICCTMRSRRSQYCTVFPLRLSERKEESTLLIHKREIWLHQPMHTQQWTSRAGFLNTN